MRLAAVVLAICAFARPAAALTVTAAAVEKGAVQVKGKGAAPSASITWDGKAVATASKSGAFRFATTEVPSDCVGEVGDGTSVAPAVVAGCAQALQQLVVKDGAGRVVGPYMVDAEGSVGGHSVALPSPDGPVVAVIGTGGFERPIPFIEYFESFDCSGPALYDVADGPITRGYTAVDGVLYYRRQTGAATTMHSTAFRSAADSCSSPRTFVPPSRCCCAAPACPYERQATAAPLGAIDVHELVPPFRVELR
jgi:hypothetical protein